MSSIAFIAVSTSSKCRYIMAGTPRPNGYLRYSKRWNPAMYLGTFVYLPSSYTALAKNVFMVLGRAGSIPSSRMLLMVFAISSKASRSSFALGCPFCETLDPGHYWNVFHGLGEHGSGDELGNHLLQIGIAPISVWRYALILPYVVPEFVYYNICAALPPYYYG